MYVRHFNHMWLRILAGEACAVDTSAIPVPKKPLKSMKMKRDPKKLRMGGGKVWEDHSLDDWDQGEWV